MYLGPLVELALIFLPIIGVVALLIGAVTREFKPVAFGLACIITTVAMLTMSGKLSPGLITHMLDLSVPLYVKIGIGVVCSVVAGIVIKILLRR